MQLNHTAGRDLPPWGACSTERGGVSDACREKGLRTTSRLKFDVDQVLASLENKIPQTHDPRERHESCLLPLAHHSSDLDWELMNQLFATSFCLTAI